MRPALLLACLLVAPAAHGGETRIAVAANFTDAARKLAATFEAQTGHKVILSFGASGQLATQIIQSAPFDALLSADSERPAQLVAAGLARAENSRPYAIGRLVLWSRSPDLITGPETLTAGTVTRLAIANPASAPYGVAALQTLDRLGLGEKLEDRLVQGSSITQTYQFIATGNAELGFVALSQVTDSTGGSRWLVPAALHSPIRQDAVLLNRALDNPAATGFITFLTGPEGRKIITSFGYEVP